MKKNTRKSGAKTALALQAEGIDVLAELAALKAMTANVSKTMTECFFLIENEMFQGPWVMGSQFTICDPYLFAISSWLESDGVDVAQFPLVIEHRSRMHERDTVKRVMAMQNA